VSDVNNDGYGENDAYNCGTTKSCDFSDDDYNQGMDDELDQDAIDPGFDNDQDDKVDLENDFQSGNEDYDLDNDADPDNNDDDPENSDDDRNANTGQDSKDEFSSDYHGAPISYRVLMILLLTYTVRHKLTNEAISDLLYIIGLVCPQPNYCCSSLHKFKKYFSFKVLPSEFLLLLSFMFWFT